MRKTVAKNAKKKSAASLLKGIKKMIPSQIATPRKTKKNAEGTRTYRDSLLAKQVESHRANRGVNPDSVTDPAHMPGHRRINLKAPARS